MLDASRTAHAAHMDGGREELPIGLRHLLEDFADLAQGFQVSEEGRSSDVATMLVDFFTKDPDEFSSFIREPEKIGPDPEEQLMVMERRLRWAKEVGELKTAIEPSVLRYRDALARGEAALLFVETFIASSW